MPQRLLPREIGQRNDGDAWATLHLQRRENARVKYQKRLNTRGKRFPRTSATPGLRQDRHLICVVGVERLRPRSFSHVGVLSEAVHILFTSTPFSPCQRLQIRNRGLHRQEKILILFSSHIKKTLTEKSKRAWPKTAKMVPSCEVASESPATAGRVDRISAHAHFCPL